MILGYLVLSSLAGFIAAATAFTIGLPIWAAVGAYLLAGWLGLLLGATLRLLHLHRAAPEPVALTLHGS